MTPAAPRSPAKEAMGAFAHHLAQDQLLQAHAQGMGEHASAQAADGAGRDLQHPDALVIDPHFGVDRPGREPGRAAGARHLLMDAVLERLRQPRRCDVERFLEVGPVQGIGLVEQGEGGELPSLQAAFQGVLAPGNEVLDDQAQLLGVAVGTGLDGPHPVHGPHQLFGIVGTDHAAAPR